MLVAVLTPVIFLLGTDSVEETNFKACWDLVCAARRDRKEARIKHDQEAEEEEDRRRLADAKEKRRQERQRRKEELAAAEEDSKRIRFDGSMLEEAQTNDKHTKEE